MCDLIQVYTEIHEWDVGNTVEKFSVTALECCKQADVTKDTGYQCGQNYAKNIQRIGMSHKWLTALLNVSTETGRYRRWQFINLNFILNEFMVTSD